MVNNVLIGTWYLDEFRQYATFSEDNYLYIHKDFDKPHQYHNRGKWRRAKDENNCWVFEIYDMEAIRDFFMAIIERKTSFRQKTKAVMMHYAVSGYLTCVHIHKVRAKVNIKTDLEVSLSGKTGT